MAIVYATAIGRGGKRFIGYLNLLKRVDEEGGRLLFRSMSNRSSDSYNISRCNSEEDQLMANFINGLVVTGVGYAVVPQRFWDYRKWIAAEYPCKDKLFKFLCRKQRCPRCGWKF